MFRALSFELNLVFEWYIVDFQFNLCYTRYKCVLRRQFVFPVFSNFPELTLYEGWFWCKDFPLLMNESRFPAGGRFHFLLPTQTLPPLAGNSLSVIQKAKLLNMNSKLWLPPQVKVWGDSGKRTIIWRNLMHTKLLKMRKESLNENGRQHCLLYVSLCMCIFIVLIQYQGWSI